MHSLARRLSIVLSRALLLVATLWSAPGLAASDEVIETEHFRFHPRPDVARRTERLAENADRRYVALCRMLRSCDSLDEPIDVWLADDAEAFARKLPGGSPMAEWAVGVAFVDARRIVLRTHGSAFFTLRETFDHEISHVLVHAAAGGGHIPRWFSEGVAIWQAGESVIHRLRDAQEAALTDNLLPLSELDRSFPDRGPAVALAYAEAALFVRWLQSREPRAPVPAVLRRMRSGASFDEAFRAVFQEPADALHGQWREQFRSQTSAFVFLRNPGFLWLGVAVLLVIAIFAVRRRRRLQWRKLELREALEREQEEALLRARHAPPEEPEGPTYH